MCCTPGRCPCWPRQEPFTTKEIYVLTIIKDLIHTPLLRDVLGGGDLWRDCKARLVAACARIPWRRLPYVLSTFVQFKDLHSLTLLECVVDVADVLKWVLDAGVCPNMGLCRGGRATYQGWVWGPRHPGRPPQHSLTLVLHNASCYRSQLRTQLFLTRGSYPPRSLQQRFPASVGQWRRWHARASRRLWVRHTECRAGDKTHRTQTYNTLQGCITHAAGVVHVCAVHVLGHPRLLHGP
jgi:hypothetical protein